MDKYQGDLTDVIRASTGGSYGAASSSEAATLLSHHDHFQFCSDPMNFSSVLEDTRVNFGTDPYFSDNMREDPFLHMAVSSSACFESANSAEIITSGGLEEAASYCFGNGGVICSSTRNSTSVLTQQIPEDDDMTVSMPCNNSISSNMIQISPDAKLCDSQVIKPSAVVSSHMINANTIKDCMVQDNTRGAQISSTRNPGLKRRKNQARKAICIPAPSPAANSRQGGEVVPSDLWAWRKYGQKPIKGSPYPRGYYRCSSSKGCSARKQVERSRTDPNMLVITYTSEHNHPWPTQRNALAGSTRISQPYSKNNNNNNNNIAAPIPNNSLETTHQSQKGTLAKPKEERQSSNNNNNGNSSAKSAASVKEEIKDIGKLKLETNDIGDQFSNGMIPCKPSMLMCNQSEDLFAKLGEIEEEVEGEEDSLNLLALDPFHLFEW